MMFRLTGYQNYLLQAGHIADMLLRRLPADGIPYWDFDAPVEEHSYRDASAAAIMASAFIELSRFILPWRKSNFARLPRKSIWPNRIRTGTSS
jgi:unsaturated chondroitin disaccharide hydrolase